MTISTTRQPEHFAIHKNKFFTNDFYTTKSKEINIDLSFLVDLNLVNMVLKSLHVIKHQQEITEETYRKNQRTLKNFKSISRTAFLKQIHLFKIFHSVLTGAHLPANNLSELAYRKMFEYSIRHNQKQIGFIPKLEFTALTINKYSYLYNFQRDKGIKKEIKLLLKEENFVNTFDTKDKIFFNFFFKTKFPIGKVDYEDTLKNEFLLQKEIYLIYQEYLVLLTILKNGDKTEEYKTKTLETFFQKKIGGGDILSLVHIIPELENRLFINLYNHVYQFFNFEELSGFKTTNNQQSIFEGFQTINKRHKELLFASFKK